MAVANNASRSKSSDKPSLQFVDNRVRSKPIQLKTLTKAGVAALTVEVPTDPTHWTTSSPRTGIKDRIGKIKGTEFADGTQLTKLKPKSASMGDTNVSYGAKHFGNRNAGGTGGTVCHVADNGVATGYDFTIPHYHACTKAGALTFAEATGAAAVAGVNDGMHLHYDQDVTQVQNQLNATAAAALRANGETVIDQAAGQIP